MDRRSWIKALIGAAVGAAVGGKTTKARNGYISTGRGKLTYIKNSGARDFLLGDTFVDPNATRPFTGVTTRSFNNQRTGSTSTEAILTPKAIRERGLKTYWSALLPDDARGAEAQPLTAPNVKLLDGSTRSLLIVATMGNWVRAFDVRDGSRVWARNYGTPVKNSPKIDMYSINDHWGICGTPSIDPAAGLIYFVNWTSADGNYLNGQYFVRCARIADGSEASPAIPLADVVHDPGNGLPKQRFGDQMRKVRSSTLLGRVQDRQTMFFGCGCFLESGRGASGWLLAIDTLAWRVSATWATTARYSGAGIWMAGQGVCQASDGDLYFSTGNGGFDGVTDWGESFIRLRYAPPTDFSRPTTMRVVDNFTPYDDACRAGQDPTLPMPRELESRAMGHGGKLSGTNEATMRFNQPVNGMAHAHVTQDDANKPTIKLGPIYDQDLNSGGVSIVESLGLVLGAGKDGVLYAIRKDSMGGTRPADLKNPAANYAKLPIRPFYFTFYPGEGFDGAPNDCTELNRLFFGRTHHMHGGIPIYEGSSGTYIYCWGENGNPRAWRLHASRIEYMGCGEDVASARSPVPPGGMPGGMMCVSSNGKDDGSAILWTVAPFEDANKKVSRGRIRAYCAAKFGKYPDGSPALIKVWESEDLSYNKFNPPIVDGGRLYYATYDGKVVCVGLV